MYSVTCALLPCVTPDLVRQLTDQDQDLYKNFPLVISERWQSEVAETVFDTVNAEADKLEQKKRSKHKQRFDADERGQAVGGQE